MFLLLFKATVGYYTKCLLGTDHEVLVLVCDAPGRGLGVIKGCRESAFERYTGFLAPLGARALRRKQVVASCKNGCRKPIVDQRPSGFTPKGVCPKVVCWFTRPAERDSAGFRACGLLFPFQSGNIYERRRSGR